MFSRKFSTKFAVRPRAAASDFRSQALAAAANPYVGASGAAFLLLATVATLIGVLGDPKAGSPMVRLTLAGAPGAKSAAWSADSPDGVAMDPHAPPLEGQAVITLGGDAASMVGGGSAGGGSALPQAPIAGLFAPGPGGPLPVIAPDGRTPAQAYARPFVSNGKPRVAVVIGGLGLNPQQTRKAIESLPAEVTLSFVPYADGLQGWIDLARASGHEVMLETPMEPTDYPDNDPGPYTLMAQGSSDENARKLEWVMSRATGYFGLTNYLGSKFMATSGAMADFTSALRRRGLAFVDDGSARNVGGGLPRASAAQIIDDQLSPSDIDRGLLQVEAEALRSGQAMGAGFAYPVTIDGVARWAQGLDARGYQLAPVSALTARR